MSATATCWEDVYRTQTSRIAELERENAELRKDKERLDWILTEDGGHWVNWMFDIDEWTPELKASRDAIDACLRPSTWKEAQP